MQGAHAMKRWIFALFTMLLLLGAGCAHHPPAVPPTTSPSPSSAPKEYPAGQYVVGMDLSAGDYKLTCTSDVGGYYCISSDSLGKEILANDYFENQAYIQVEDGQYLKLSRCIAHPILLPAPSPKESPAADKTTIPIDTAPALPSEPESPSDAQQAQLDAAIKQEQKRNFMLCIAQDDLEGYCWGGKSSYAPRWQELLLDHGYDGQSVLQEVRNDLDLYLTWGTSSLEPLWLAAEAIYGAYDSGRLQDEWTEEEYQNFLDRISAIQKRLGILYSDRDAVPS